MLAAALGHTLAVRYFVPPKIFALTDSAAFNAILAEIPFFAVGLLAFAVLTFFVVLRRVTSIFIYLHASALVGFTASILDLAQLLTRGIENMDNGTDSQAVSTLIAAREIGFAISVALRFMFFWALVAEPPRGEMPRPPSETDKRPNFLSFNSDSSVHSGRWDRWGIFGILLKWALLAVVIAIGVLQIIWRIVNMFSQFGPVYDTEATMEIVGSALFILKLLLNASLTPNENRLRVLGQYSVVLVALGINLALGAGDLLCFTFSETILGRFLQAIELYIMILYVLIVEFYPTDGSNSMNNQRASSFRGLPTISAINPRGSMVIVSPPVGSPRSSVVMLEGGPSDENGRRPPTSRQSSASRLSSWLSRRISMPLRYRDVSERDQVRLWKQNDSEKGTFNLSPGGKERVYSPDTSPLEPRETAKWRDPVYTTVVKESPTSNDAMAIIQRFMGDSVVDVSSQAVGMASGNPEGRAEIQRGGSPRQSVATTVPSYYAPTIRSPSPPSLPPLGPAGGGGRNNAESPIYGLDGIMASRLKPRRMSGLDSQRSSGISNLLRQQKELDKSIAQLRLFSPRTSASGESTPSDAPQPRPESTSVQSDFSLSNFPQPPWEGKGDDPTTPRMSQSTGFISVDAVPFDLVPPQMPIAAEQRRQGSFPIEPRNYSIDSTETVTATRPTRFDSQGTQYDVTSFMADLTTPGRTDSTPRFVQERLSAIESDEESTKSTTIVTLQNPTTSIQSARPVILPSSRSVFSEDDRETLRQNNEPSRAETSRAVRYALGSANAAALSPTLGSFTPGLSQTSPPGSSGRFKSKGKGVVGLPPRPRLAISEPKIRNSAENLNPGVFEDPRPVPSLTDTG